MKVPVVDDDPAVRGSVQRVLVDAGYEVTLAADGHEAVERFDPETVDLLLLDIGLPIQNGWDAFERITSRKPALPVIIMTGQSGQSGTSMAAGVGALMEKPLDAAQLLDTMKELLAEPEEVRLRRMCGYHGELRHVRFSERPFLRNLRRRHGPPFRYPSSYRE